MNSSRVVRIGFQACRWLAGLEVGVWGGLAVAAWFALTAVWSERSVWELPNRLGSLFYGARAGRAGFHAATCAGLAFHLFTSAVVGLAFACLAREGRNRLRVSLLGLASGLGWCYLAYAWFWRRLLPPANAGPPPWLLAAYLLFGAILGCYPGRLRSAERHFLGEAAEPSAEHEVHPGDTPHGD